MQFSQSCRREGPSNLGFIRILCTLLSKWASPFKHSNISRYFYGICNPWAIFPSKIVHKQCYPHTIQKWQVLQRKPKLMNHFIIVSSYEPSTWYVWTMPTVLDLFHLNARPNWIHKELAAVQLQRFCRGFLARKRVKEKRQQQRQLARMPSVGAPTSKTFIVWILQSTLVC